MKKDSISQTNQIKYKINKLTQNKKLIKKVIKMKIIIILE
jgi:hypothetical protein